MSRGEGEKAKDVDYASVIRGKIEIWSKSWSFSADPDSKAAQHHEGGSTARVFSLS